MIYVIYGSQTGNSEEIAKRIQKEIKENIQKDDVELVVMNKFMTTIQKIPENKDKRYIIVAVCSTTGAGDAPGNCDNFIRWIKRKTHAPDTLTNVDYTILGLGDSNYTKYQFVPRQLDDGLAKIGAKKFYQRGEADDAYGLEIVVEPWIEGLYPVLEKKIKDIKTQSKSDLISTTCIVPLEAEYKELVQFQEKMNTSLEENKNNSIEDYRALNAQIISRTLLSGKKSEREIYSLKINFLNSERELDFNNYEPGAFISIIPPESEERIKKIKEVISVTETSLKIDKSHHFKVYSDFWEKYPHFKKLLKKGSLTLKEIFTYIIDFNSVLKKSQVESVRNLINEKLENKEITKKFENLFSKYTELILRNRISLFDVLNSLSLYNLKIKLSLLDLLEYFPIKYPRCYSLLSYGYERNTNPLEIVYSVVNDRVVRKFGTADVPLGFKTGEFYFKGQTTNYLSLCPFNEEIFICDIGNCFNFPISELLNDKKPIIYLCNGTGISPCISMIKKLFLMKDKINPKTCGNLLIFTGFRSASDDKKETVYEDFLMETMELINEQVGKEIISYYRCLSMCSENEEEEVGIWRNCRINTSYVQDLIIEHEDTIHEEFYVKQGYLMICGDIQKLYDESINNIMGILMKKEGFQRQNCVKYLENMKLENRLIIEKWA